MRRSLLKTVGLTLGITTMLAFSQSVNAETVSYKIKKGDTLYSIAKKFHTTVAELKKINQLHSDVIYAGKLIYISKDASYDPFKVNVRLKPKAGYTFDHEEPGRYILQYKKNGNYFARIEILDANSKISDVKKNSINYLLSTGKVTEYPTNQGLPLYKNAYFFLHAHNKKIQQNIVVKKVDGKLVRFTIHFENKEGSEGITPNLIEMLQSIKF
ncbi:LysM peptidoglycan-binding domain-containing protein [Gottfriedia luciferensis]|uniref:LysM peptidoglycan-binding domain-containing protein n=1 Tax=Gottfriedia luciferensis TaxID=178774 RepID=UPI000B448C51|nr:LysM peptidoglycan-binding domain-containing protein [Gottfriedia luciferensis]